MSLLGAPASVLGEVNRITVHPSFRTGSVGQTDS